jgi:signal transduction histidine kinase
MTTVIMTKEELAAFFKEMEDLKDVPMEQLKWMSEKGSLHAYDTGDLVIKAGDPVEYLQIFVSGRVRFYVEQKGKIKDLGIFEPPEITGLLPYSRLKAINGYGEAKEPTIGFKLHKDHFREMIRDNHELTTAFVHKMASRIRTFTSTQLQTEKLMSLGKLSAGLAHELNNPASAIVRSATALKDHLKATPEAFKKIIDITVTGEQVDYINELLVARMTEGLDLDLSLMEKTEKEDEMLDWLDDREIENSEEIAESMVEFGFSVDDLDDISDNVPEKELGSVLMWINNNLVTEKMVEEIGDASQRISELVKSIKSYTHMDQSHDKQKVDIHKGIRNTLRILQHKTTIAKIEIIENFDENLTEVFGFPGELNQVFTNLIDNAIDALEDQENKKIELKTWKDGEFARIYVIDNGKGIPEDIIGSIFDPFYTTKDMDKGTGMGLDVVKKIVEQQHKGVIRVKSKPGKTEFEVCIPIGEE